LTVSGRNFYRQIQLQSFHTAWALRVIRGDIPVRSLSGVKRTSSMHSLI
jgi:hypothetical protein